MPMLVESTSHHDSSGGSHGAGRISAKRLLTEAAAAGAAHGVGSCVCDRDLLVTRCLRA